MYIYETESNFESDIYYTFNDYRIYYFEQGDMSAYNNV